MNRLVLVGCALLAALALPGTALGAARTYTLKGKVEGDANSAVSVKVVVVSGKPRRLKGLTYRNLDANCDGSPTGELSGSAGRNVGPSGFEFDGSFRWVSYPANPSRNVNMFGKVRRRGRLITATLEVFNNDFCSNAKGKVRLRKV